jgi:hypothetical protein
MLLRHANNTKLEIVFNHSKTRFLGSLFFLVSFCQITFGQCIPSVNSGTNCALWITNVNIVGTTLNSTTACTGPYTSYPASGSTTANLITGTTYTISVANDGTSVSYCSIWLDVNNDGIFNCSHSDELVVKNLVIAQAPFGAPGAQTALFQVLPLEEMLDCA